MNTGELSVQLFLENRGPIHFDKTIFQLKLFRVTEILLCYHSLAILIFNFKDTINNVFKLA